MVGVFLSDVLDPKVVDDEGETYGFGGVLPERSSSGNRGKSKVGKVSFEPVVGGAAGLFEAGYAFSDLKVDPASNNLVASPTIGSKLASPILASPLFPEPLRSGSTQPSPSFSPLSLMT